MDVLRREGQVAVSLTLVVLAAKAVFVVLTGSEMVKVAVTVGSEL